MNLAKIVSQHARYRAPKTAIESADTRLTYGELDVLIRRIATRLRQAGAGRGDLIGLHLKDNPVHVAAFLATMHVGGIVLPLDWRAARAERARVLRHFPVRAVISDSNAELPADVKPVTLDAIEGAEPDTSAPDDVPDHHPLVYSLTSGTTGEPKSIVLTHEQMFGRAISLALESIILAEDRVLAQMPLAYSVGRVVVACALSLGSTLLMFPSLFEPVDLARFVRERGVTALILSPNVGKQLAALGSESNLLLPGLRNLVFSGAKQQPEDRARIAARVCRNLIDFYGSTGGGPTTVIARPEDGKEPTSVGRPMAGADIEVVDESHLPVSLGVVGRIRIKGIGVCRAFAGPVTAGDEGFRDGWYYPGDLGSFDAAGLLHINGRASDFIKRGGVIVFAQEVEGALKRHPNVLDAAVVGARSAELGEEVVAFVVLSAGEETSVLVNFCRRELAPAKVPAKIFVVDELPRNPNGKVQKSELRARL